MREQTLFVPLLLLLDGHTLPRRIRASRSRSLIGGEAATLAAGRQLFQLFNAQHGLIVSVGQTS